MYQYIVYTYFALFHCVWFICTCTIGSYYYIISITNFLFCCCVAAYGMVWGS